MRLYYIAKSGAEGTCRLRHDTRGVAALEFAVAGPMFLGLVLFVMALGFRLYTHAALDYAAGRTARLLAANSQTRSQDAANPGTLKSVTFCQFLSPFLGCGNATVSLQSCSPDFRTCSATSTSNPGTASGSLMLLQASYPVPTLSSLFPSWAAETTVTVGYPYQNED